jgi:2-oxoglutarate dehydrogenase complex dehydrogenase (E1) component-like enzyme
VHFFSGYPSGFVAKKNRSAKFSMCTYSLLSFVSRGHNELDNPSLTQPVMYDAINKRTSVPDEYNEQLEVSGQPSS